MMRVRSWLSASWLLGAAVASVGCTANPAMYHRAGPPTAQTAPSPYGSVAGASIAAAGAPCAPPPCAPPPPAPCAPPPPPPCAPPPVVPIVPPPSSGLPCERGVSEWHVRALAGYPFFAGTDPAEGCNYFGADVGTTRSSCVGVDAFYRVMWCSDKKSSQGPGTSPTAKGDPRSSEARFKRDEYGKDGGTMQFIGVKATYEHSLTGGPVYGYVGAGPEYFWTSDYIDDDDGFGGFGEVGIGWRFSRRASVRLGLDVHGDYTSVTRKDPANSGQDRWLWTFAPNLGIEIDF